ncbi:MAG TPA: hypothetical protein VIC34_11465 [Croceibacterium sp.]|jgi:hypothetical protein
MATDPQDSDLVHVPLSGTRAQSLQRLQIGLGGVGAMVLLVGVANVIVDRVKQTDASRVPGAAATATPTPTPVANDPLADAGVAPEVAVSPTPKASGSPPAP